MALATKDLTFQIRQKIFGLKNTMQLQVLLGSNMKLRSVHEVFLLRAPGNTSHTFK